MKELQSIVDYTRSPATTQSPAIAPIFTCTAISNEIQELDYPFYWTATTHAGPRGGAAAMYVAFGRAAGWMSSRGPVGGSPQRRGEFGPGPGSGFGPPPPGEGPPGAEPQGQSGGQYRYVDVHGAGAQRSDPKIGDPANFPRGRGPQGDVIRIFNFVRARERRYGTETTVDLERSLSSRVVLSVLIQTVGGFRRDKSRKVGRAVPCQPDGIGAQGSAPLRALPG